MPGVPGFIATVASYLCADSLFPEAKWQIALASIQTEVIPVPFPLHPVDSGETDDKQDNGQYYHDQWYPQPRGRCA